LGFLRQPNTRSADDAMTGGYSPHFVDSDRCIGSAISVSCAIRAPGAQEIGLRHFYRE